MKAAEKPETAERDETMGMDVVKQSVMDVLFDLMEVGDLPFYGVLVNNDEKSWDIIEDY